MSNFFVMYKNVLIEDYTASKRSFSFDPGVDIQEVEQFGFVDLRAAIEKGIVPSVVPLEDSDFNEVALPGTLMNHAQDVFESLRQAEYVREQLKYAAENKRKSAERAAESAAAAAAAAGAGSSQFAEPSVS